MIELSVIVDAGKPFVYDLEDDYISSVRASVQVKHWPNVHAVARR